MNKLTHREESDKIIKEEGELGRYACGSLNSERKHVTVFFSDLTGYTTMSEKFDPKRLKEINPVHSIRHACAVRILCTGDSIADIKNRLGHENLQSTMAYLDMDLTRKPSIQEQFRKWSGT